MDVSNDKDKMYSQASIHHVGMFVNAKDFKLDGETKLRALWVMNLLPREQEENKNRRNGNPWPIEK